MRALFATALSFGPDELVRVDVPDYPGAETSSEYGSLLLAPPTDGTPWRYEPYPEVDATSSDDLFAALQVDPWHEAGITGQGVKVAVFDVQWFGAEIKEAELGEVVTHDCFTHRSCEVPIDSLSPRYSFETGQHGVACAEIIEQLAPDAELHLVRVNGLTTLESATDWAIREGIDLVSMSLSFFNESFYDGTGAINEAMDRLAAADVLMVTSAGNYANQHYKGVFDDVDLDDRHDFPWGTEYLAIDLSEGSTRIYLNWDQYGDEACGTTDLDAYVYDGDGNLAARSRSRQVPVQEEDDSCEPVERMTVRAEEAGWYYLMIHRRDGPASGLRFDVMSRGGSIWRADPAGSITDPGTHPLVFTVGAVAAADYLDNDIESFSSQGPTAAGLHKPDIAGPDGLSSSVYGQRGFFGTSASTPAVTGALALLLSEHPTLLPHEAAERLEAHASLPDQTLWAEPSGVYGAGYARLPEPGTSEAVPPACGGGAATMLLPLLALGRRRQRALTAVSSRRC